MVVEGGRGGRGIGKEIEGEIEYSYFTFFFLVPAMGVICSILLSEVPNNQDSSEMGNQAG